MKRKRNEGKATYVGSINAIESLHNAVQQAYVQGLIEIENPLHQSTEGMTQQLV
jgi:hypothetical protein